MFFRTVFFLVILFCYLLCDHFESQVYDRLLAWCWHRTLLSDGEFCDAHKIHLQFSFSLQFTLAARLTSRREIRRVPSEWEETPPQRNVIHDTIKLLKGDVGLG